MKRLYRIVFVYNDATTVSPILFERSDAESMRDTLHRLFPRAAYYTRRVLDEERYATVSGVRSYVLGRTGDTLHLRDGGDVDVDDVTEWG